MYEVGKPLKKWQNEYMKAFFLILTLSLALPLWTPPPWPWGTLSVQAHAQRRSNARTKPGRTAADARRIALKRNGGGRVLSVQRAGNAYRVKVIKNRKVRVIRVPR